MKKSLLSIPILTLLGCMMPLMGSQAKTDALSSKNTPPKIFIQDPQDKGVQTTITTTSDDSSKHTATTDSEEKKRSAYNADKFFDRTKRIVPQNLCSMRKLQEYFAHTYDELWEIHQKTDTFPPYISNCSDACVFMLGSIANLHDKSVQLFKTIIDSLRDGKSTKYPKDGFHGSFDDFTAKKEDRYLNGKMQKWFTRTSQHPTHELITMTVYYKKTFHSFVIEKCFTGKEVWFRIYQSWCKAFTLAEWLGIDPWNEQDLYKKFHNKHFKDYGKGKKLTQTEIQQFIAEIPTLFPNVPNAQRTLKIYTTAYQIAEAS